MKSKKYYFEKTKQEKIVNIKILTEKVDGDIHSYLANRVKEIRKEKGISQIKFAEMIGLSRVSISNIESGKHHLSMKILETICDVLKIKSSEILPF